MGLQEKQAIAEIEEKTIPKHQKRIKEHGVDLALKVDWASIPQTKEAIARCNTVLGEFTNKFWDLGQNKVAKDEITKNVKTVTIKHDASLTDQYDYKLNLNGNDFVFTANFDVFTFSASGKQKGLKAAIEESL